MDRRDLVEMMYRPSVLDDALLEKITKKILKTKTEKQLINMFEESTRLEVESFGYGRYRIK